MSPGAAVWLTMGSNALPLLENSSAVAAIITTARVQIPATRAPKCFLRGGAPSCPSSDQKGSL